MISKVEDNLTYKRFESIEQLLDEVDHACVKLLKHKKLIQLKNYDEALHLTANIEDIDQERLDDFIAIAREKRGFPLKSGTSAKKVLAHLNMIENELLTNSALLAFGLKPQKFFKSAIVKCAHFHGTHVVKPIADQKVISGDVFEQVDQSIDFVLSKISMSVGLRDQSNQAPLNYEIPRPVVVEAIVNAVAHRDYTSNGSVHVSLFVDRLEITNPGYLAPELSIEKLKKDHGSYPPNKLLAEVLYQTGDIERYGTGTGEIFRLTADAGLKEPVFSLDEGFKVVIWRPSVMVGQVTGQAGDQVGTKLGLSQDQVIVLCNCLQDSQISDLMDILGRSNRTKFRDQLLNPLIEQELIEMTLPDKPTSPKQRYRLTKKGKALKKEFEG